MVGEENTDERISELEDQIESLEDRIEGLEDIFAPAIIDRQTTHVDAKKQDARDVLSEGEVKIVEIFDPPGQGDDPNSGVGKIEGIVTFVNCDGLMVREGDEVQCRITDVMTNAAQGVATRKLGPQE